MVNEVNKCQITFHLRYSQQFFGEQIRKKIREGNVTSIVVKSKEEIGSSSASCKEAVFIYKYMTAFDLSTNT